MKPVPHALLLVVFAAGCTDVTPHNDARQVPTGPDRAALHSSELERNLRPATCDPPKLAYEKGQTGKATLSYRPAASGKVEDVRLEESSGNAEIDQWAVECLGRWSFDPNGPIGEHIGERLIAKLAFKVGRPDKSATP